jgi:atypical dual specificity phosphatase
MQVPPESITFNHYNGTISLFSSFLPTVYDSQSRHIPGHITLVTAEEYKRIKRPHFDTIISALSVEHVYLVGEGQSKDGQVKWECVIWNEGDRWRTAQGLVERRYFHVTTTTNDNHEVHKGISSVINRVGIDGMMKHLEGLSVEGMHQVILGCEDEQLVETLQQTLWLHTTNPRETIKYVGHELPRNFSWIYPFRIAGMSTPRSEDDIDCLERMGITDLLSLNKEGPLPRHWFELKKIKHHQVMLDNYAAPTCAEMDVIWDRVSAGGTWLVHCGGGVGRAGTVIACLMTMLGYGDRRDTRWENEDGTRYTAPVLGSDEAIRLLRLARPKSIESDTQAAFVSKWVSHRWKILGNPPALVEPSHSLDRSSIRGKPIKPDKMDNVILFLIGKPGSGKSFFSEMVTKRRINNRPTIIISQDDCGSKDLCEKEISREWAASTLLIFDRCNPKAKDRKIWLKKVHPDRRAIAVHFDYDKDLCRQRIDQRIGHPTIRAGKGVKASEEMDKTMESPSLNEGFDTIVRIDSFSAAKDLATKYLTPPITLRKFPRTPHLIDTGAAADDDLLCDIFPSNGILEGSLTIEEKIDGANLGISLDNDLKLVVQNRSHLIHGSATGQFKGLDEWLDINSVALSKILLRDPAFPERYILYGEWCHAKHSVHYTRLDDRFLAFDLYDRVSDTNCARGIIDKLLQGSGIAQVPFIKYCDTITKKEVMEMIQGPSAFTRKPPSGEQQDQEATRRLELLSRMEGIYIRFEDPKRQICEARGKIVRGDFITIDARHWTKSKPVWNKTKMEIGEDCEGSLVEGMGQLDL